MDSLDELITQGRMSPQLASTVVSNFDKAIAEVLSDRVKATMKIEVVNPSIISLASPLVLN